jgi:hypothetical protein
MMHGSENRGFEELGVFPANRGIFDQILRAFLGYHWICKKDMIDIWAEHR